VYYSRVVVALRHQQLTPYQVLQQRLSEVVEELLVEALELGLLVSAFVVVRVFA
jgi:hypothetical protein